MEGEGGGAVISDKVRVQLHGKGDFCRDCRLFLYVFLRHAMHLTGV